MDVQQIMHHTFFFFFFGFLLLFFTMTGKIGRHEDVKPSTERTGGRNVYLEQLALSQTKGGGEMNWTHGMRWIYQIHSINAVASERRWRP